MEVLMTAALALPWLTAFVLLGGAGRLQRLTPLVAMTGAGGTALALSLAVAAQPATGSGLRLEFPMGSFFLDGLSAMFGLLTAWIHFLVALYAWRYMPHARAAEGSQRPDAELYALLAVFAGAMLAMVASAGLVQLYLFWELTGIASFLLIGYWQARPEARAGAFRSLLATSAGGVAMLVGFLGLGQIAGTFDLPALLAGPRDWAANPLLPALTAAILLGALAKSAQLPFSGWLPGAMAAPAPVSAFLHSATLIAAGIYLLARFFPLLHAVPTWSAILVPAGVIGGVIAGLMALRQSTIKALLAYSTISQYAFIFMAFGLGSVVGAQAGLYAFFVHAFIKAGLFLVAGAVTTLTDEQRFSALGGLARSNRTLAILAAILAFSLGGLPIFGGFYYKEELLYAAYVHQAWLLLASLLGGGMLTFLYMLQFLTAIFTGTPPPGSRPPRPLPRSMLAPIGVLAAMALGTGLAPNWMNQRILNPAIASVIRAPADFTVELEVGGVFLLSLAVLALGGGIWAIYSRGGIPRAVTARLPSRFDFGGAALLQRYEALGDRLLDLHGGNLRRYLRWELMASLGLILVCWWALGLGFSPFESIDLALALLLAASLLAALATLWLRFHVLAVIALTISGYALAGVFALMHAPDVALAQVLVETLATFSIVMALRQSRQIHPERTAILTAGRRDWGRWAISLGMGGAMALLTYVTAGIRPSDSVGERFATDGYALNGMADLVTAILADFRALDTAVEILVFTCAALGVMGLFPRRRHE